MDAVTLANGVNIQSCCKVVAVPEVSLGYLEYKKGQNLGRGC